MSSARIRSGMKLLFAAAIVVAVGVTAASAWADPAPAAPHAAPSGDAGRWTQVKVTGKIDDTSATAPMLVYLPKGRYTSIGAVALVSSILPVTLTCVHRPASPDGAACGAAGAGSAQAEAAVTPTATTIAAAKRSFIPLRIRAEDMELGYREIVPLAALVHRIDRHL